MQKFRQKEFLKTDQLPKKSVKAPLKRRGKFINKSPIGMKNDKTIFEINNEPFSIDIKNNTLDLIEIPFIQLSIYDMRYTQEGYKFNYDPSSKTILGQHDKFNRNEHIQIVMPHLSKLVPNEVAKHYGLQLNEVLNKTDYDVMHDKRGLFDRQMGKLAIVEIEGHDFYVDFQMKCIRPSDKIMHPGISFDQLDDNFSEKINRSVFPYNPQTHTLEEIDCDNLTSFPKHLVVISIPHFYEIDPFSYSRDSGFSLSKILKETPQNSKTIAKTISWEKLGLTDLIKQNKERLAMGKKDIKQSGNRRKM